MKETMVVDEIVFSARVASSTPFWTLLASISGAFWPPRWLKPIPPAASRRPWRVHHYFFGSPEPSRNLQGPSKRLPRMLPQPKMLQDGSKMAPGSIWEPVWPYLAAILGPCRSDSGASLRGLPETAAAAAPSLNRNNIHSTIGP